MRYAIIESGVVSNIAVAGAPLSDNWIDAGNANLGDIWNGTSFLTPKADPSIVKNDIIQQTQTRLDHFAQTRGYDNILSATTYATSQNSKFAQEGQYAVEQRDATWTKLLEILTEIESGIRPVPSGYSDIEAELPVLIWPN